MHPQEQLVFHKEAAEAFSKPAVPFQSCISSGSFNVGTKVWSHLEAGCVAQTDLEISQQ